MTRHLLSAAVFGVGLSACSGDPGALPARPPLKLAPGAAATAVAVPALPAVPPMYTEVLPVDAAAVTRLALAQNLEILDARERVAAARGSLQRTEGRWAPSIVPSLSVLSSSGSGRATQGNLLPTDFTSLQAFVGLQWVLNPGQLYYETIAARKRLLASRQSARATDAELLRKSLNAYYELIGQQARVAAAGSALRAAAGQARLIEVRHQHGAAVDAEASRAQAERAARASELALALKGFYDGSIILADLLNLEPTATLVPAETSLSPLTRVRDDLPIQDLLAIALERRDDLAAARTLILAAHAERQGALWGGLGPSLQASAQDGGISSNASIKGDREKRSLHEQQNLSAGVSWQLGLATLGDLKSASAEERRSILAAASVLSQVKSEVARSQQACKTWRQAMAQGDLEIAAAEQLRAQAQAAVDNGAALEPELLHALARQDLARLHRSDAVSHYNQSQIDLLAALGALPETLAPTPPPDKK